MDSIAINNLLEEKANKLGVSVILLQMAFEALLSASDKEDSEMVDQEILIKLSSAYYIRLGEHLLQDGESLVPARRRKALEKLQELENYDKKRLGEPYMSVIPAFGGRTSFSRFKVECVSNALAEINAFGERYPITYVCDVVEFYCQPEMAAYKKFREESPDS